MVFAAHGAMGTSAVMRRRPGLWIAVAFAAGIASAHGGLRAESLAQQLVIVSSCVTAAVLLALLMARTVGGPCRWVDAALLIAFAAAGALRYWGATELLPAHHIVRHPHLFDEVVLRGYVDAEVERFAGRTRFVLMLSEVETDRALYRAVGRVLVTVRSGWVDIDCAQGAEVRGFLRRPTRARNPGAFDYRSYLAERGLDATISLRSSAALRSLPVRRPWRLGERAVLALRLHVRSAIEQNLQGAQAGLLLGLLLGDKTQIPTDIKEHFRAAGLSHALVVSGMHVGIVAAFVLHALHLLSLPISVRHLSTMAALIIYSLVTQLHPPVVRAAVIGCIALGGAVVERDGDAYNSLGWAALFILVLWPVSLLGLSFQLSFAATMAIVGLYQPLLQMVPGCRADQHGGWRRYMAMPLCVSLAAQLGTTPLLALHFQQWAPIGLLANLVVAPLLAAALGLGMLAVLSYGAWPLLCSVFNGANYWFLSGLVAFVERSAQWPGAALSVPRPDAVSLLVFAILLLLVPHIRAHRVARTGSVALLLLWLNLAVWERALSDRRLQVFFLDVGQGDAAVVRLPNGMVLVVDGGQRRAEYDYGERVLVPFLRAHNMGSVDVVVATHPHSDHIGGLVALLEHIPVRHYIDSGQQYDSWTARRLRSLIREQGVTYHRVAAGDSLLGMGAVGGLVLHPTAAFVDSLGQSTRGVNNGSVALKLSYGEVDILFTGDIEGETDTALLAWGARLQAEVLKVAHHGSSTSSSARFLRAVRPDWAVISVGEFNRFGHPSSAVVTALQENGASVLRTDRSGAVILSSDGRSITVDTAIDWSSEMR